MKNVYYYHNGFCPITRTITEMMTYKQPITKYDTKSFLYTNVKTKLPNNKL